MTQKVLEFPFKSLYLKLPERPKLGTPKEGTTGKPPLPDHRFEDD